MPAHRFLTPKAPVEKRLLAAMTIPATFMEEGLQVSAYSFRFVNFIGMNDTFLYGKKTISRKSSDTSVFQKADCSIVETSQSVVTHCGTSLSES